jgi:hypothetical protein
MRSTTRASPLIERPTYVSASTTSRSLPSATFVVSMIGEPPSPHCRAAISAPSAARQSINAWRRSGHRRRDPRPRRRALFHYEAGGRRHGPWPFDYLFDHQEARGLARAIAATGRRNDRDDSTGARVSGLALRIGHIFPACCLGDWANEFVRVSARPPRETASNRRAHIGRAVSRPASVASPRILGCCPSMLESLPRGVFALRIDVADWTKFPELFRGRLLGRVDSAIQDLGASSNCIR